MILVMKIQTLSICFKFNSKNPLNLSDTLDIYLGHDLDNNNDLKGTKNYNINYTIPYKSGYLVSVKITIFHIKV